MSGARNRSMLGVSVAWGYAFAVLLVVFILTILVPDADGPSPWDATAFRSGMIELIANFRILDELADLGVVKVADVGTGLLIVDLEQIGVSNRRFGTAPFYMALTCGVLCFWVRAFRLRLLTRYAGVPSSVRGQLSAFFFGRGLNLLFPFGPGELGTVRALSDNGADAGRALTAVFLSRVLEVLAIALTLFGGFVYLGWGGAVGPFIGTVVLIAGVVSLTQPLGRVSGDGAPVGIARRMSRAFGGDAVRSAVAELLRTPGFFVGILALSLVAFGLEVMACWSIKQAFSSPMDDYVLMKDLAAVPFTVVVAVAALARVVPYTAAGFGTVELVMVVMFRIFGEGYLGGTTVALLSALLLNGIAFGFFLMAVWFGRTPGTLDVWHQFFEQSEARGRSVEDGDTEPTWVGA